MLLAFVVRVDQALSLPTPQLLCDEFIYAGLASGFAEEGRLLFRGEPLQLSLLYPILLAPAWLAEHMETTYDIAKTINVALMTASAVPVFLLGRRVVTPGWALLAPVLTLLLPMTLLSGLLMTESAFLPAFLLALYAIVLVLERPTWARQGLVLVAVGLASAVRLQGLVLVAVLVTALLIMLVFELTAEGPRDRVRWVWERVRPYWPTAALFSAAAVVYLGVGGLGAYEEVARAEYSLGEAWRMTKLHLADLALTSGLVPLSALILLSLRAFVGDTRTQSERAFLAVATAATPWLLVQAGLFTSRFTSGGIAERYVFYVMPVLFVALALWLARGLPRPWLTTAVAAVAPAAVVLTEPLTAALSQALLPSSLGLFSFYRLSTSLEGGVDDLVWLIRIGTVAAAVSFGLLWRPAARIAIPLGLCALFFLSNHPVTGQMRELAIATSGEPAINPDREWIQAAVDEEQVGYLFTAAPDAFSSSRTMLTVGFWNPSVGPVVHLGEPEICRLPARSGRIDGATGRIVTESGRPLPRLLVAPAGLDVAGSAIAQQGPLVLYRTESPASLRQSVDGVYADRWMGADASYTRYYGPGPGQINVDLSRQIHTADAVPSTVQITSGPLVIAEDGSKTAGEPRITRRAVLKPGEQRVFSIPAPKLPVHLTVHIEPTFSALAFGGGDQRQLGAQVQFGFEPSGSGSE